MTGHRVDAKTVKQKTLTLKRIYYKQSYEPQRRAEGTDLSHLWPFYQDMDEILSREPNLPAESDVFEEDSDEEAVEEETNTKIVRKASSQHTRAKNWSNKEVKLLLSIWKDPKIGRKVAQVTTRHKRVFQDIADRINKVLGKPRIQRTDKQVRFKIKDMKVTYRNIAYRLNQPGGDNLNPDGLWIFYQDMHEIMNQEYDRQPSEGDDDDDGDGDDGASDEENDSEILEKGKGDRDDNRSREGTATGAKKYKNPRASWSVKEIKTLLSIWKEPKICAEIARVTTKPKQVYQDMLDRLKVASGAKFTVTQLREKTKEMKITFRKMTYKINDPREDVEALMAAWPYYQDMQEILAQHNQSQLHVKDSDRRFKKHWSHDRNRNRSRYSRAKPRVHKCSWSFEETKALVSIWKDPVICIEIAKVTTKHKPVYQDLTDRINTVLDRKRSVKQVREKIKEMKSAYRKMSHKTKVPSETNDLKDGDEDNSETWPFYQDMEEIMALGGVGNVSMSTDGENGRGEDGEHGEDGDGEGDRHDKDEEGNGDGRCDGEVGGGRHGDDEGVLGVQDGGRHFEGELDGEDGEDVAGDSKDGGCHDGDIGAGDLQIPQEKAEEGGQQNTPNQRNRSVNWTDEEIKQLLSLWKRPNISSIIAKVTTKPKQVYQVLADCLNATRGTTTQRSPQQVRIKIKEMKEMYKKVATKMNEAGDGEEMDLSSVWCFYHDVHDIMKRDQDLKLLSISDDDNIAMTTSLGDDVSGEEIETMQTTKDNTNEVNRPRSSNWSDKEIQILVSIWKRPEIMNAVISDQPSAYQEIATRFNNILEGTGHVTRDSFQVKIRMNTLKRMYQKISSDRGLSPHRSTDWPFYDDLRDIMNQIPSMPSLSEDTTGVFCEGETNRLLISKRSTEKPKDGQHPRSANWSDEELKLLLSIWKEPDVADAVACQGTTYKSIYQDIADRLNKSGVRGQHRDGVQVRERIRSMKKMHKDLTLEAEELGEYPGTSPSLQWEYYEDMDEILRRPFAAASSQREDDTRKRRKTKDGIRDDTMDGTGDVSHPSSTSWSDKEVKVLVSIWKKPDILKTLPSGHMGTYKTIADQINDVLEGTGHKRRDLFEVKRKMTLMQRVYKNLLQECTSPSNVWPFFKDMQEIMSPPDPTSPSALSDTVEVFFDRGTDLLLSEPSASSKNEEGSSPPTRSRSATWSDEEVKALLSIWKEPAISKEVARVTTRHKQVFQDIADRLKEEHQVERDRHQVRCKIRDMRRYYIIQLANQQKSSAKCDSVDMWPYFEAMHKIVGSKTISSTLPDSVELICDNVGSDEN